jgi:hypothetical protein
LGKNGSIPTHTGEPLRAIAPNNRSAKCSVTFGSFHRQTRAAGVAASVA